MKRLTGFLFALVVSSVIAIAEVNPLAVRYHSEATDTSRISAMLVEGAGLTGSEATGGDRMTFFARKFLGVPYVGHTLESEDGSEVLTVNIDELDCTTLVETAAALAITLGENRTSWRDYVYNLRRLRYRGGETDGYASRLHYIADWTADGIAKGLLRDATLLMPRNAWCVRTIDYMSGHKAAYPALADSAQYARIRRVENGLRNHRFPYLRTADLGDKKISEELREGDILAFVSGLKDLDVTHMGVLVKEDGEWRVLHASSSEGKVVVSRQKLSDFLKRNRQWTGVRVLRLL